MLQFPHNIGDNFSNNPTENIYIILKETKQLFKSTICIYYRINRHTGIVTGISNDMNVGDEPIITNISTLTWLTSLLNGDDDSKSIFDIQEEGYSKQDEVFKKNKLGSFCSVTVKSLGKVVGCLFVGDISQREYKPDEINALKLFALMIGLEEKHKSTSDLLITSDYKYGAIFENANDCIVLLKNNIIVDINQKGCDMFGYSREEILGMESSDISPENSSNGEININQTGYMDAALKGEPQHFEWIHQKKDGTSFYTDISLTRLDNSDSYNTLAIIRDISKQKRYEKELIEAREKATELNRMKSLSLASMSHELRTPLNSIIGFSDLLLDEDTTEDEKEMFSKLIQTAGRSLMQLIGDIVDISKIEAGQVTIQKTMFNVNSFLQKILLTFKQEKDSRGKSDIELKLVLSDLASELRIETDPHRLQQVFNNLLTNSLKFIDNGFIEFGYLSITPKYIQFYVKDTGVGIDNNKREVIFEQYGQDKSTYNRNNEGTGLGLAISKSFVELLGGNIWLDSEIDEGSTFYFTIPFKVKSGYRENYLSNSLNISAKNWSGRTIVIADDVKENYVFLRGVLSPTGVKILWAQNGKEAFDFCKVNNKVDMVLMDIRMPVMNGLEASRLIKKNNPETIIIAQTAFASAQDKENCIASGCDEYFKKPINHEKLFSVIAEYFK